MAKEPESEPRTPASGPAAPTLLRCIDRFLTVPISNLRSCGAGKLAVLGAQPHAVAFAQSQPRRPFDKPSEKAGVRDGAARRWAWLGGRINPKVVLLVLPASYFSATTSAR